MLLIIWAGGIKKILDTLALIDWYIFLLVIILYTIGWILRGLRWKYILKNIGVNISLFNSIELVLIGNTYNLIMPAKLGDIGRIIGLKKLKPSKTTLNLSSVVIDRFLDFVAVIMLLFISLPFLKITNLSKGLQYLIYLSPLFLIIFVTFYFVVKHIRNNSNLLQKFPKKLNLIICNIIDGFALSIKNGFLRQIVLSLSIWIVDSVIAFFFYISIRDFSFNVLIFIIFGVMLGNLTKVIPFTPGGIGTFEAAFAAVLSLASIPVEISVTIALIDHLFKNFYTVIFGIGASTHLGITMSIVSSQKVQINDKNKKNKI